MSPDAPHSTGSRDLRINRRTLVVGGTAVAAGWLAWPTIRRALAKEAPVFLARNQRYDGSLVRTIRDGLLATGFDPSAIKGRVVLLKPNLVEPDRAAPHMTTNPTIVVAAAEVFRGWGASVRVGEAPGHVRDTEMALVESGMQGALDTQKLEFADLNYEPAHWITNRGGASRLDGFYFPRSVVAADVVVSMPKLKTQHWVGMTAALKNLYGTLPGSKYGWPKNVLHHAGIPQTVVDINASLPRTITIVDAIDCMEGDGPILGSAKSLGVVAIGLCPAAVDATCARLMGLVPGRISYLKLADGLLGPLAEAKIPQRGEPWRALAQPFEVVDRPHLKSLLVAPGSLTS